MPGMENKRAGAGKYDDFDMFIEFVSDEGDVVLRMPRGRRHMFRVSRDLVSSYRRLIPAEPECA